MRLVDCNPKWIGKEERRGLGIYFDCPCCDGDICIGVYFENPIDGGSPAEKQKPLWTRIGDDFENLTIKPSIDGSGSGHWHGHVTNGEIV